MSFDFMHTLRLPRLALAAALVLGGAACDNPVEEEHEEHPVGFVVLNAQGQELARFDGATVTGQLTVSRTAPSIFTVVAIGEDGDEITIDGTELELRVTVEAGAVTAAVEQQNRVAVTATQPGTGSLRIAVWHHDDHEEFGRSVALIIT